MRIMLVQKHVKYVLLSKDISSYIQDGDGGKRTRATVVYLDQSINYHGYSITFINTNLCCVCSALFKNFYGSLELP